ncbi:MAG: NAD(P)H-hydrate dehydratase [Simkaniaceae bacterium]|nr:NAD(P)H-hydrate dehydratase [Simkaniaceae bacterium]
MKKVVTASEMARVEKKSIEAGASSEQYMLDASKGIANLIDAYIDTNNLAREVLLVVGKGNNGGDAFTAGEFLLELGYLVKAYPLFPKEQCSELCSKHWAGFTESGGEILEELTSWGSVVIDGLLGTGFEGLVEGKIAEVIRQVNTFEQKRIAIDIPSGVNGNTGEVKGEAIRADLTIYLGLPKWGCFNQQGFEYIGELQGADFGLESNEFDYSALYPLTKEVAKLLPIVKRTRHKYEAGYVVSLAGSPGMAGAAILSSLAALRTGAGIVRLFHPEGMEGELTQAPLELIKSHYAFGDTREIEAEMRRASALVIGPGIGRSEIVKNMIFQVLEKRAQPVIIDADGLFHLQGADLTFLGGQAILTPHRGEMSKLVDGAENLLEATCDFAKRQNVTVVLKGAPTWIVQPNEKPIVMVRGCPGMATAGSGDVLSGIIGALLAQGLSANNAALLGTYLHGISGEIAVGEKTNYGLIASDMIEKIPCAIKSLQGLNRL